MNLHASVLVITLAATAEANDRRELYVAAGPELTGVSDGRVLGGLAIEGAMRLGSTPLFVRARAGAGIGRVFDDTHIDYLQARLGAELRGPLGFVQCFAGVDAAVERAIYTENESWEPYFSTMAVPRTGVQIGDRTFGQVAAELPIYYGEHGVDVGFTFNASVGAAF